MNKKVDLRVFIGGQFEHVFADVSTDKLIFILQQMNDLAGSTRQVDDSTAFWNMSANDVDVLIVIQIDEQIIKLTKRFVHRPATIAAHPATAFLN